MLMSHVLFFFKAHNVITMRFCKSTLAQFFFTRSLLKVWIIVKSGVEAGRNVQAKINITAL